MPNSTKHRQSTFNPDLGLFVVPGEPQTLVSLVKQVDRYRKATGITSYRICKNSGMEVSIKSADRFFEGYRFDSDKVKDAAGPGRVTLETTLEILHAMGLDLEVVVREKPGKA